MPSLTGLLLRRLPQKLSEDKNNPPLEALKIDKGLGTKMSNAKEFITIDEYNLLDQVSKAGEFSKKLVEMIKKNNLYSELWSDELEEPNLTLNPRFMESLRSVDNTSEKITQELCKARPEPYTLICDIIRTKAPRNILVDKLDKDGEPIQMESSIIEALKKEELTIKVYIKPILNKKKGKSLAKTIKKDVQRIIEEWKG